VQFEVLYDYCKLAEYVVVQHYNLCNI